MAFNLKNKTVYVYTPDNEPIRYTNITSVIENGTLKIYFNRFFDASDHKHCYDEAVYPAGSFTRYEIRWEDSFSSSPL